MDHIIEPTDGIRNEPTAYTGEVTVRDQTGQMSERRIRSQGEVKLDRWVNHWAIPTSSGYFNYLGIL